MMEYVADHYWGPRVQKMRTDKMDPFAEQRS